MPRQPRPPDATPGSPGSRAGLTIIGEYRNAASVPPARPPQHPAAPAAEGTQRLTSNPTGAPRPHKAHRTGPRASTAGRSSRSPTTPQRPGRSTSGLDDAPVVVETTTRRGPTAARPQRSARATARTLSPAARRRRVSPSRAARFSGAAVGSLRAALGGRGRRSKTNQEGETNDVRYLKDGAARAVHTLRAATSPAPAGRWTRRRRARPA